MTFTLKHFKKDYEDFIAQQMGGSEAYRVELERDHHLHHLHDGKNGVLAH
jgi:hypothetical protein